MGNQINNPKEKFGFSKNQLTRRAFLKLGIVSTLSGVFPESSFGSLNNNPHPERILSLYNIHTDERLKTAYWQKGSYLSESLDDINYIMRDYRTEEVHYVSIGLLDLLHGIYSRLNTRQFYHIVSGYRSPITNDYLYRNSTGVSKNSLHMYGMAVDIRIPMCSLSDLYNAAKSMKGGGVGYYPESDFTHIDVGEVRFW
jgi:uncharacterized protein YcbK (DUF882 family)